MSLKDTIFSNMGPANPDTLTPQMATPMAAKILNVFKTNMLNEAKRTPSQDVFHYDTYLITGDTRLFGISCSSNKKGWIEHCDVTDYAVSLRQALISLAEKDGIVIGNYIAVFSSGSDDDYYYGGGIMESPRFILQRKSKRSGRCFSLPLTREGTYETFLRAKTDRITNAEGVYNSRSLPGLFLALPISFYAVR